MKPPVIGVSCSLDTARWGAWETLALISPRGYTAGEQAAGGVAFVLSPDDSVTVEPDLVLEHIDGLVVAGGVDVDPVHYGAARHPETAASSPAVDAFELSLLRGALELGVPLLGVCRGMQLLNVACEGTLVQHIPQVELHRSTPGRFDDHEVVLADESLAAAACGATRLAVKSHHHQAVGRLGADLVISGWSSEDGVAEAIELPTASAFALGVQWHPEQEATPAAFRALVAAARERANSREQRIRT